MPRAARLSRYGVFTRLLPAKPSASARSVSIVMRRTSGGPLRRFQKTNAAVAATTATQTMTIQLRFILQTSGSGDLSDDVAIPAAPSNALRWYHRGP